MTTFPKPKRIVLENYKIPSWNSLYSSPHWTKRQELKEEASFAVMEALNGKEMTMCTTKVHVTVVGHFKRPLDCDNIASKLVIDPLKGKIIQDDTPKYVSKVTTESVKSDRNYTEIIIEEEI